VGRIDSTDLMPSTSACRRVDLDDPESFCENPYRLGRRAARNEAVCSAASRSSVLSTWA
jgi:hypothetical protein